MRPLVCLAVLALVFSSFAGFASAETCYTAVIDGVQAGTGSSGTGTATFFLNDAETELTYNISFSGLSGAETAAHLHSDAEAGGVVHALVAGSPKIGTWNTVGGLTAQRVADLKAGFLYVNIHSTVNPGGEIRGQIILGPCVETCFDATIDGSQAGTGSTATGTGLFTLNHTQTELSYNIQFSGLLGGETAAHIHSDAEGGGVVHPLVAGTPKVGTWNTAGGLTVARVADLLNGQLYVNIHSTVNAGGEIRGQVLVGACNIVCFESVVDGAQAGTASSATGLGYYSLNHNQTELDYNIEFTGLGSAEVAAHIHSDAEGGGVVHPLVLGTPKIGTWDSAGALTPARVADLLAGQHYVNIHSTLFPTGEIRGQLLQTACAPTCFASTIDGTQAGTGSSGTGSGLFALNHIRTQLIYNIEFSGLSSAEVAAHIHSDAEGGGVVHPLAVGSPKIGIWDSAGGLTLTRAADLINGDLYVNIHSTTNPAGEIRGQVIAGCGATGVGDTPRVVAALSQNYPNPFNPTTTITYSLLEPGHVSLNIYDVAGRLVRTLVEGSQNPGIGRSVDWDGRNNAGQAVASGVYLYRLQTSGFAATRKMVLLK